jgi:hypothetical protein
MSTTLPAAICAAPAIPAVRQVLITDTGRGFSLEATSPDGIAAGRAATIRSLSALIVAVGDWAADAAARGGE